jgi:hypothetical protein
LGAFYPFGNMIKLSMDEYLADKQYFEDLLLPSATNAWKKHTRWNDSKFKKLFDLNENKVGTFLHELSHAYRGSEHAGGHAGIKLRVGPEIKDYSFDEAASKIAAMIHATAGFWQAVENEKV